MQTHADEMEASLVQLRHIATLDSVSALFSDTVFLFACVHPSFMLLA